MLVSVARVGATDADGAGEARLRPPRPKQPEVLVTTAATGDGVPELLAALDRHRATDRAGSGAAARLARAEAQVWAVLADRLRSDLLGSERRATTESILRAVADHELDPYSAADRLRGPLER
jgi:LAO/AO transport system kinase